jgi:orotate phosphoribosyltransferase
MPLAPAAKKSLVDLVRTTGYERRDEPFQLSSGGWSRDYVDGKYAVAGGAALRQACQAAVDLLGDSFDSVGGPTMGADALAHGVAVLTGCSWFSVRKEPKGHGRAAWVEGARLREGDRVVMVEDVVSTGASLLRAAEKVGDLGATVVAATALVDRSPQVAERFRQAGIDWRPLLTWSDLGIEPL